MTSGDITLKRNVIKTQKMQYLIAKSGENSKKIFNRLIPLTNSKNFIKKEALTQVLSFELCENLRTPFLEHLWWLLLYIHLLLLLFKY